jgi:DNA repair ATPase RecN
VKDNEFHLQQELKSKDKEIQASFEALEIFQRDLQKTLQDNEESEEKIRDLQIQVQEAETLVLALGQENFQLKNTIEGLQANMAAHTFAQLEKDGNGSGGKDMMRTATRLMKVSNRTVDVIWFRMYLLKMFFFQSLHSEITDSAYGSDMCPEESLVCFLLSLLS